MAGDVSTNSSVLADSPVGDTAGGSSESTVVSGGSPTSLPAVEGRSNVTRPDFRGLVERVLAGTAYSTSSRVCPYPNCPFPPIRVDVTFATPGIPGEGSGVGYFGGREAIKMTPNLVNRVPLDHLVLHHPFYTPLDLTNPRSIAHFNEVTVPWANDNGFGEFYGEGVNPDWPSLGPERGPKYCVSITKLINKIKRVLPN